MNMDNLRRAKQIAILGIIFAKDDNVKRELMEQFIKINKLEKETGGE